MTTVLQRRHHWLDVGVHTPRLYQFGQLHDSQWDGGSAGCGAAVLQVLRKGWHPGRPVPTMDLIAEIVGRTPQQIHDGSGTTSEQMLRGMRRLGVHYREAREGISAGELLEIAKHKGPVVFACTYGVWPDWMGYEYFGTVADGRPNGFARAHGMAGRTQLTGFDGGRHYGLLLSSRYFPGRGTSDAYVRDPNHASISRPERPPYDVLNADQWGWLLGSGVITGSIWAAVPKIVWEA